MNRQNKLLQDQLFEYKSKFNKQQEEFSTTKLRLREREWEVESLRRELNTKNSSMDKIRNEKMVLEKELTMLQDQMTTQVSQVQVLESSPDDLEVSFLRDTVSQLEIDCKNAVDERDMLQSEMASLQAKLSQLQEIGRASCRARV